MLSARGEERVDGHTREKREERQRDLCHVLCIFQMCKYKEGAREIDLRHVL